jgi:hypothetical protein
VVWFLSFFVVLVVNQQELVQDYFLIYTSHTPTKIVFSLPWSPLDWWMDPNLLWSHSAAGQWDYLFEDEHGQQIYTPTIVSGSLSSGNVWSNLTLTWIIKTGSIITTWIVKTGSVSLSWIITTGSNIQTWTVSVFSWPLAKDSIDFIPEENIVESIEEEKKSCITSWWEEIQHKDFILAYKQRRDVSNICDVQKRYCINGKLTWSYPQKSCKEDTRYSYTKQNVVSYNTQTSPDPLIQPSAPSFSGAKFDVHGKINTQQQPIDVWWEPNDWVSPQANSVPLLPSPDGSCTTPWGERVKLGHIVKAYSAPVWLIDVPCEVEIRLCAAWILKWSFTYRTCTFKKMTYRDYLVGNYDVDKPTAWDLINTIQTEEKETTFRNSAFRRWLDKLF